MTFDNVTYNQLLVRYQPKIITTEKEYDRALETVEQLMANKNRSSEQTAMLQLLVTLIEDFENKYYPMPTSPPYAVLEHLMEARGMKHADLVGILSSKGVTSEVINGKRSISKTQAKVLGEFFNVSPALFI